MSFMPVGCLKRLLIAASLVLGSSVWIEDATLQASPAVQKKEYTISSSDEKNAFQPLILAGYWKYKPKVKPPNRRIDPPPKPPVKQRAYKKYKTRKHSPCVYSTRYQTYSTSHGKRMYLTVHNGCKTKRAQFTMCVSKYRSGHTSRSRGYSKRYLAPGGKDTLVINLASDETMDYDVNGCGGPGCNVFVPSC